jgi:hypothetical protein
MSSLARFGISAKTSSPHAGHQLEKLSRNRPLAIGNRQFRGDACRTSDVPREWRFRSGFRRCWELGMPERGRNVNSCNKRKASGNLREAEARDRAKLVYEEGGWRAVERVRYFPRMTILRPEGRFVAEMVSNCWMASSGCNGAKAPLLHDEFRQHCRGNSREGRDGGFSRHIRK